MNLRSYKILGKQLLALMANLIMEIRYNTRIHFTTGTRVHFIIYLFLFIPFQMLIGQVELPSSFLPIIVIQTGTDSILDDPRIVADMGIIAHNQPNRITDSFNEYDGKISIEIRGSSSQSYPKKSYGLETQTQDGENRNVSLLGMPKENDWILHGPYSDKSLLRNKLAFELGSKLSQYAPRTRLVELLINEDYRGVYVLMEKIKRDKNRVGISALESDSQHPDSITGGYIIKLDKSTGSGLANSWRSSEGNKFQYEYPKAHDINGHQKEYIQQYIDSLETVLFSNLYQDPQKGYQKYLDLPSFVDFVIINELSKNVDGYRLSTFFNKERGKKLKAGPIWDFNIAFGNANYCVGESPAGWVLNFNLFCPNDGWKINTYWDRLLSDPSFAEAVVFRWQELRQSSFSTDSIVHLIEELKMEMGNAPGRNFERWPILDKWVWPNVVVENSYQGEIDYLKNWVSSRLAWMDENIADISTAVQGENSWPKFQVYPNPFTEGLTISVLSTQSEMIQFEVFDLHSRRVAVIPIESQAGYTLYFQWDGKTEFGTRVPPGIYLYRLVSGKSVLKKGKLVCR